MVTRLAAHAEVDAEYMSILGEANPTTQDGYIGYARFWVLNDWANAKKVLDIQLSHSSAHV